MVWVNRNDGNNMIHWTEEETPDIDRPLESLRHKRRHKFDGFEAASRKNMARRFVSQEFGFGELAVLFFPAAVIFLMVHAFGFSYLIGLAGVFLIMHLFYLSVKSLAKKQTIRRIEKRNSEEEASQDAEFSEYHPKVMERAARRLDMLQASSRVSGVRFVLINGSIAAMGFMVFSVGFRMNNVPVMVVSLGLTLVCMLYYSVSVFVRLLRD